MCPMLQSVMVAMSTSVGQMDYGEESANICGRALTNALVAKSQMRYVTNNSKFSFDPFILYNIQLNGSVDNNVGDQS